jgi:tellurite resistance protein TerC
MTGINNNTANRFAYLGKGLGIVLAFIGFKMLISGYMNIPIGLSLTVVGLIPAVSVILSLLRPPARRRKRLLKCMRSEQTNIL